MARSGADLGSHRGLTGKAAPLESAGPINTAAHSLAFSIPTSRAVAGESPLCRDPLDPAFPCLHRYPLGEARAGTSAQGNPGAFLEEGAQPEQHRDFSEATPPLNGSRQDIPTPIQMCFSVISPLSSPLSWGASQTLGCDTKMDRHSIGSGGSQVGAEHRPATYPRAMGLSKEEPSHLTLQVKGLQGGPQGLRGQEGLDGGVGQECRGHGSSSVASPPSISLRQNPNYLKKSFN